MDPKVVNTNVARNSWREVVDTVQAGKADVVVERYGKPMIAVIPYDDYVALQDALDDIRAARTAGVAYKEWKKEPSSAISYNKYRKLLIKEDLLDE